MYRDPGFPETKSVVKTDPLAPARSTIRRQRTVRYNPHVRDRRSSSRSRSTIRSRDTDRRSLVEVIRRGESSVAITRSNARNIAEVEAQADLAYAEASQRRRLENGRALLRDALSYERPIRHLRVERDLPPIDDMPRPLIVLPDSRQYSTTRLGMIHRSELDAIHLDAPERLLNASEYLLMPPHTSGDTSSGPSVHNESPSYRNASSTPSLTPTYRLEDIDERAFREYVPMPGINRPSSGGPDNNQPTRHTRRRRSPEISLSHREVLRGGLDGLGDRQRSFSPEDDSWNTLLTTMTPDERLPSVQSSFLSTTTTASSLYSNAASSYGISVTAPSSSIETLDTYPTICDNSDIEISESEEHSPHNLQESSSEDIFGQGLGSRSSRRALRQRSYLHSDRRGHNVQHRRVLDREEVLQQIRSNLDVLERQAPEEWWITADRDRNLGSRAGRERL